jgi:hypothetical protein
LFNSIDPKRKCRLHALLHQSAVTPWTVHVVGTLPRPAVEPICKPFMNQIAVLPLDGLQVLQGGGLGFVSTQWSIVGTGDLTGTATGTFSGKMPSATLRSG